MELKHEFLFGKFQELKGLIFSKIPRVAILDDFKLRLYLLKQFLKTQKKLKELEVVYQIAVYISIS